MKQDLKNLDGLLVKIRKDSGLSKKEVSAKAGIHAISVANIENASVKNPRLSSLVKYLNALGYGIYIAPVVPAKAKITVASINSEMNVDTSECVIKLDIKIVPD